MKFDIFKDAQPVMLIIAPDGKRVGWLFEYLTEDSAFDLLHNPDPDEVSKNVSIRVDSKVFESERGHEATIREMVSTVGKRARRLGNMFGRSSPWTCCRRDGMSRA